MPRSQKFLAAVTHIGPGIAVAAAGVGAADLVTASVAGSRYGNTLLWAVLVGTVLKYVLNESVARWQLATGTSVFEGWSRYLGRGVVYGFLAYLVLWTFFVSGGLIVAAGLAGHTLFPAISARVWGVIHAIVAYVLVLGGSYERFEQVVKVLVAMMFIAIIGCAIAGGTSYETLSIVPSIPRGSLTFTLGLIGGVGGSVTMLAYGYWIQEKQWKGVEWLKTVRLDLGIGYGLTGLFAIGVMLLSTEFLFKQQIEVQGQQGLIQMASILNESLGATGEWIFLAGFWGAVFTSILGVFQGVPYLFSDFMFCRSGQPSKARADFVHPRALSYRLFLTYMTFPSMLMLLVTRPVWIIVVYAAVSSLFLPFLALTLLYLNNRTDCIGDKSRNGWFANLVLTAAVALFLFLGVKAAAGW
jgi:Mn2+/Fe2+ NRAMP family transporter